MAYSSITKPADYFNTILWTGDGTSSRSLTGVGFQPDWTWIKRRSASQAHSITDSVRGVTKSLRSDSGGAEDTSNANGYLSRFDTDGFTVAKGSDPSRTNTSSATYVGWSWLADGTASSNSDGSITSSVSANTTAGFSIGTFTGNATAGATVGHGLGATPAWIICRTISAAKDWCVYHHKNTSAPETEVLILNTTAATFDTNDRWNDTAPTSSVFTIGDSSQLNTSGGTCLFYAFAEKKGYSKFGSYTGNGNADGPMIFTGFKPSFIIGKNTSRADDWFMLDNKRDTFNPVDERLQPNSSGAEVTVTSLGIDFCSNGFKLRGATNQYNASGETMIYMCFAESPFTTSTGIPTTAR